MRRVATTVAAAAWLLAVVPAQAAEVSVSGADASFRASAGERADLAVTRGGDDLVFVDSAAAATAGEGCRAVGASVRCAAAQITMVTVVTAELGDSVRVDLPDASVPEGAPGLTVSITAGDGDDVVDVDAPDASVALNGGDDVVSLAGGRGLAWGESGNDRFESRAQSDSFEGGPGDDVAVGGALFGGPGNDQLAVDSLLPAAQQRPGQLVGGAGNDLLVGAAQRDFMFGGAGADRLVAGTGDDSAHGGAGGDVVDGGPGDDITDGGGVAAFIDMGGSLGVEPGEEGEDGADVLLGGDGNDRMTGGPGDDRLDGGAGWDMMSPGVGADVVHGGADRDLVEYLDRTSPVALTPDGVANDGEAGEGDMIGQDVEDLEGGAGDDVLVAGPGTLSLTGVDGNDRLVGGPGAQGISGGRGDDVIIGGGGFDDVSGDPGSDRIDVRDISRAGDRGPDDVWSASAADDVARCGPDEGGPTDDRIRLDAGRDFLRDDACERVDAVPAPIDVLPVSADGVVSVPLACPASPVGLCQGTVSIRRVAGARARVAARPDIVAQRSFELSVGDRSKLRLRLKPAARRQLRRRGRLKSRGVVTARLINGTTRSSQRRTVLKRR